MEYVKIDALDATLSLLGFGSMRLPLRGTELDDIDVAMTKEMVDIAIRGGVNYFDTAYGYHKEASEDAIRQALVERYDRSSYYLADKLAVFLCNSPEDQQKMFETQLKRCGVDYFDFYLIHAITEERYAQCCSYRSFDIVKRIKDEGRARRIGFSYHSTPEFLERVLDEHPEFEFIQLQINYLDWKAQRASEYYRIAHERGLPIIVMEPVKGGSLASLVPAAAALDDAFSTPEGQAAFALRFAASQDGVMTVLSGMTTPAQVESNVKTFSDPKIRSFTDRDMATAEAVLAETRKISQVPCTECAYCVASCPADIEIPKIFSIYNEFKRSGVEFHAQYLYSCIPDGHRADSCVKCGACSEKCPQKIDIPAELAKLHPELPVIALVPDSAAQGAR